MKLNLNKMRFRIKFVDFCIITREISTGNEQIGFPLILKRIMSATGSVTSHD